MLESVKVALEERGYKVSLFKSVLEANTYLNKEIDNVSVGIGGSVTVKEMGLFSLLKNHNTVWWHNDPEQVAQYGVFDIRTKASLADIYISSVNAITQDGIMINLDATGNRIASTIWGHKKVYLLIGNNKVCKTFEDAMYHVKNVSAPQNAKRLNLKTPCAIKGDKCYNCKSLYKICRTYMIYEAPSKGVETEIILIDEHLGY